MIQKKTTLALLTAGMMLCAAVGPAVAQQTPDAQYYNNTTTETGSGSWLSGLTDATLSDILDLALRIGTFLIGDTTAQGGVGSAGALLTGLLMAGIMGGVGMRSGAGSTGGVVIGVAAGGVFVAASIGAVWAYPVVLFVIGLIVAAVFLRVWR